ncbi:MAG: hypothetical protein ABI988_11330 [Nitrospirota bacterium]
MNNLLGNSIRAYLVATLFLLAFATATLAQDVKVPFLFTDDEKLDQTQVMEAIPRSSDLQSDPYLNAPMTRLEYILTLLETYLQHDWIDMVRQPLSDGFALRRKLYPSESSISIKAFARYPADIGRIIVGYHISDLGQPKRAMRTTCDRLLSDLAHTAPQDTSTFFYHNTILGVLLQDDFRKYTPALEVVAKSIVHKVILESEDTHAHYTLTCQRTGKGTPTQYQRHSFKIS